MKASLLLAAALAVGTTGCLGGVRRPFTRDCPPDPCPPADCQPNRPPCTSPTACEGPERIVVQAPKTTFVVEQPCNKPQPTGLSVPQPQPTPTGLSAPQPQPTGMQMMPTGGVPLGGQIRDKTGLGFSVDYIRIPIPFLRPMAIQRPSEMTIQVQQQPQQQSFSPVGFAPTGFAPTGFMPQPTGFVPMPTGFAPQPSGFAPMPTGFAPQPSGSFQPTVQYGQMIVPSQVPVGLAPPAPTGVAPAPTGVAPPPKTVQEMLDDCNRKLEESNKRLKELEKKP